MALGPVVTSIKYDLHTPTTFSLVGLLSFSDVTLIHN